MVHRVAYPLPGKTRFLSHQLEIHTGSNSQSPHTHRAHQDLDMGPGLEANAKQKGNLHG